MKSQVLTVGYHRSENTPYSVKNNDQNIEQISTMLHKSNSRHAAHKTTKQDVISYIHFRERN